MHTTAEIEDKVGVGLSVLLPVAAPTAEGLQGSASTGRHPVVETVMEGSPAHVDGRIAPGDACVPECGCACVSRCIRVLALFWLMT